MERMVNIVEAKGGIVSANELSGWAEYIRVRRAVERGELIRVKQGVYAEPTSVLNTMTDVERIVPKGVVCLYSAWAYHQLSTTVPPAICIAIEAKRKITLPELIPINIYYWKAENLEFGITEQELSGYKVRITNPERSVCDAIKYRNKVGLDICAEVVRSYLKRKDRNLTVLTEYAKKLRVAKVLNNYLELALE